MAVITNPVWFFDAIKYGRYETVQRFLDEANSKERLQELLELVNKNGETRLFFATKINEFSIAALLLENGASTKTIDKYGTSVPQLCVNRVEQGYAGALGFLEMLVSSGISKDEINID